MKKTLLLGCGVSREKRMGVEGDHDWGHLVTADIDPSTGCDVVCDLNDDSLPFSDAEFDEIYAFEVLEHIGKQGDWRGFFDQFGEYHRILKDDGRMFISVPSTHSPWALGDPGHTRVLPIECFYFLSQDHYGLHRLPAVVEGRLPGRRARGRRNATQAGPEEGSTWLSP